MTKKFIICSIVAVFVCFGVFDFSFAQQMLLGPREEVMLFTLNRLEGGQGRDEAMKGAMVEAQMKLTEENMPEPRGEGIIKALKSRSHPYLTLKASYDSNIDNLTNDARSDTFFRGTPGLKVNFVGKDKGINFDTYLDTEYYSWRTIYNGLDVGTGFSGYMNIGKYIFSFSDRYKNNYLGEANELNIGSELDIRDGIFKRRWDNLFNAILGRHFNRVGFDIGATRQDIDYEPDFSYDNDRFIDTYSFDSYLRIASKTRLLYGYKHIRTDYYRQQPSGITNYDDFNLAFTGALTPKVTDMVRIDYGTSDSKYGEDARYLTFTGNLAYAYSNRTNFTFNYNHSISNYSEDTDYSTADAFKLTANHRFAFNPKFNLSFAYEADLNRYPRKLEGDHVNNYTLQLGLSYAFRKWIDFSLNWINFVKKSNISGPLNSVDNINYGDVNSNQNPYSKNIVVFKTQMRF